MHFFPVSNLREYRKCTLTKALKITNQNDTLKLRVPKTLKKEKRSFLSQTLEPTLSLWAYFIYICIKYIPLIFQMSLFSLYLLC